MTTEDDMVVGDAPPGAGVAFTITAWFRGMVFAENTYYLRISRDASSNYSWFLSFDWLGCSAPSTSAKGSTVVGRIAFRYGQAQAGSWRSASIDWFSRT